MLLHNRGGGLTLSIVGLCLIGFEVNMPSASGRDPVSDVSAKAAANCFSTCSSDECLRDCIGRLGSSRGTARTEAAARSEQAAFCLRDCENADCMRTCISRHSVARDAILHDDFANASAQESSLVDCMLTAIDDVVVCGDVFLTPGDADAEGFWVCVGGAGGKFLNCTGATTASSEARQVEVDFALRLIVEIGVDMVKSEGRPVRDLSAGSARRQPGTPVPLAGQQVPTEVSFADCASTLKADRQTCRNIFGTDDEGGLADCYAGAKQRFTSCVSNLE